MANLFEVKTGSLTEAAGTINKAKTDLEGKITEMRSMSSRLLNMWEGESKNAFVKSVNDNMNLLSNFAKNLENFKKALDNGATRYADGEKEATRIMSNKGQ